MSRPPPRGWFVEVDHSGGTTRQPDVVGEPSWEPSARAVPRVRIPVRRDETWTDSDWDDATMRVWKDGVRLPIDTLVDRGVSPASSMLVGRGGSELDKRVQVEYDIKPIHEAAEDLINTETTYTANVTAPNTDAQTNVSVQSATSDADFSSTVDGGVLSTDPIDISGGQIAPHQTAHTIEGEDRDRDSATFFSDATYSGGGAYGVDSSGDWVEWDITTDYVIPEEHVGIAIRADATSGAQEMEWTLTTSDGVSDTLASLTGGEGVSLSWDDIGDGSAYNGDGWTGGDLPAGTHTLRLEATGTSGTDYIADVVCLYDARYSYTFDNNNGGSSGYLDGPELYPDALEIEFGDAQLVRAVTGGKATLTIDDTTGSQAIALSNDYGKNYQSSSNTASYEVDFADAGPGIRLKLTLSRYGSQSTTPKTGINGQTVSDFEVFADLETLPLVVNRVYDDSLKNILTDLAERSDSLWEFRRDGGTQSVEWAQVGQRTTDVDANLIRYETTTTTEEVLEKAVVKGSSQRRVGEKFTADHGNAVSLDRSSLVEGRESVTDPNTGTSYEADVDYELDNSAGTITTLASGDMVDGDTYEIVYEFQTEGSYGSGSATAQTTRVFPLPELSTNRACELAALILYEQLKDPLEAAQITVPEVPPAWSVIEAIDPSALPGTGPYDIRAIEASPGQATLRLGTRESVGDVVDDIRAQVAAVSRRV